MDSIRRDSGFSYQRFDGFDSAISEAICDNPYNEPTPLAACRVGDLSCLKRELEKDYAVVYKDYRSGKNGDMVSLLFVAVAKRHVELARLLINKRADVNYVTQVGWTPLSYSAAGGSIELAELLIDHGAGVNQIVGEGFTPLILAARYGRFELARLLIDHEAKVNQATADGSTALIYAAKKGSVDLVRLLIENGAAVNQATVKGATPLYFAAKLGNNKIVELLLANGADPNKKAEIFRLWRFSFTRSPETAAWRNHGNRETVEMLKAAKAIKKRKIVPSSEHTPLLAGHSASYSAIRQPSIGPAKSL